MESLSNDSSQPIDQVTAFRVAQDARTRMAARVRSPWWVHTLRGLLVAVTVAGLPGRPDGAAWLVPIGVIGFVLLMRWRTREIGISRANPDRWRFLALGAPWSIIGSVVIAAAMALVVVDRTAPIWQLVAAAAVAGIVTAVLGPFADHAARDRMADDHIGGTGR
jgi:hypothetical protein